MRFHLVVAILAISIASHGQNLSRNIGYKQGFLGQSIYSIIKDSKGFMWFGCSDGLWRWDGYVFTVYHHQPDNKNSLSDNFIRSLYEDSDGNLWIGTLNAGLNRLNPTTNTFTHYQHDKQDSTSVLTDEIIDICGDKLGNLWVATALGVEKINQATGQITHFVHRDGDKKTIGQTLTPETFSDSDGMIWVGLGGNGFDQLNPATSEVKHYSITHPDQTINFKANVIRDITEDDQKNIWLGTYAGLIRFNKRTGEITHWLHDDHDSTSLSHNSIWDVLASGNKIWVATWGGGLSCLDITTGKFENNAFNKEGVYSTFSKQIPAIYLDEYGSLWAGTNGDGIAKITPIKDLVLNPHTGPITKFGGFRTSNGESLKYFCTDEGSVIAYDYPRGIEFIISSPSSISKLKLTGRAREVLEDDLKNVWIATDNGLSYYDVKKKKIRHYFNDANDPSSISHNSINSIEIDSQGGLWVGTPFGLDLLEPSSGKFKHYRSRKNDSTSLASNGVVCIKENDYGLWVGSSNGGLSNFDRKGQIFKRYQHNESNPQSISGNFVHIIFEDSRKIMWVATSNGVSRYYPDSGKFVNFESIHGLPHGQIFSISEDGDGNLIINTDFGLAKLSEADIVNDTAPHKGIIHEIPNIFQTLEFKTTMSYPDNQIYFSSRPNLYSIALDSLPKHSLPPRMAITGFQLDPNNKHSLDSVESNVSPTHRKTITLSHDQNLFSIEFAALDFEDTQKNTYAYKLEGFDKDWIYSDTRRFVTYTNLDPGTYTFRAKGANYRGVWNEEGASFEIVITPPFWRTWWAYTIYGMSFIGLLALGRNAVVNRERLKAQMVLEQNEKMNLQELDHLKTKFFSNITHEFRTPLTLIQGPAQNLMEKVQEPEQKRMLQLIQSNTDRLLKLINQLLDLSKLDAREMKLVNRKVNLNSFLKTRISQFESLAKAKQIHLTWQVPENLPFALADEEKLETIVTNLISNAIKFTPSSGSVSVFVNLDKNLEVIVNDTGRGIGPDKLKHIFDRFYQVSPTDSSHAEGTGIGLALVKEYVELMRGILHVESQVGVGTTMKVSLPIEITSDVAPQEVPEIINPVLISEPVENGTLPLVLIVEDNADIREFIKSCLGGEYHYSEAMHGLAGLESAREKIPDLIISDLMMPEMDGLEFCRQIKKDKRTDHIPFIMLTAKAAEENKIEGLRTGADDYLIKPFNKAELVLKVQNLILLREKLQSNIKNKLLSQASTIEATSAEEQFILKAKTFIEKNMTGGILTVESLASEMGLSREQCYRKIMALTSLSPSALIRKLRLQKATQLLNAKWGPVSQVAYEVGFENLSHFSKAFKEEFGKLPSEYAN